MWVIILRVAYNTQEKRRSQWGISLDQLENSEQDWKPVRTKRLP